MADTTERVTFVFEAKGGEEIKRELVGIADKLGLTQRDADKAAAEIRDLKKYLEFAQGTRSADDLKKKMAEFPSLMTKISGLTRNLKDKEIRGLSNAFSQLTQKEKEQIAQLQRYHGEVKKSAGLTGSFKSAITGAIPALGMMGTGVGAATVVFQKLVQWVDRAVQKIQEFISSSIKLGAEQEEGRATMIALVGDIEAGTRAYEEFDKRVTTSPFKSEIYNLEEYAAALGTGLGDAYLDAAEAGNRYNFSAKSFTENMFKLDRGLLRSVNTLGQFSVVMEKANLNVQDIRDGTITYHEACEKMKKAVRELAEEQREMAGTTGSGALNLIRNQWHDIKEDIGEALIQYLKPMGHEILKMLKDVRDLRSLWKAVGFIFRELMKFPWAGVKGQINIIVAAMKIWNAAVERTARGYERILNAMAAIGLIKQRPAEAPANVVGGTGGVYRMPYMEEEDIFMGPRPAKKGERAPGAPKAPKGKPFKPLPSVMPSLRAELYGITPETMEIDYGPTGEEKARASAQKMRDLESRRARQKRAAEDKELLEQYTKIGKKTGDIIGGAFQASLERGGLVQFFKNLGIQLASTLIGALAGSAIIMALMNMAGRGAEGGFWGIFKGIFGFEQEGAFTNITRPRVAIVHPGEHIFNQDTIAALRGGGMPRGGRPGYEYGPETYGGAAAPSPVNLYNIIRPGVNAEVDTYRMAERGRAIAERVDA